MVIDESEMPTGFLSNKLILPADETVILTDSNPTLYCYNMHAVLISNKALYLGTGRSDRFEAEGSLKSAGCCKWRRFPLTEITCATLAEQRVSGLLIAAGLLFFALITLGLFAFGGIPLLLYGLLFGAPLWAVDWEKIRSPHRPCALRIEMGKKSYTWCMPSHAWEDDEADDIDYDCRMVRSTLDKLAELGVKTAQRERRLRD